MTRSPTTRTDTDEAAFRTPGTEFRPAAYWFWHGLPDADTARRQLADFKARGVGTVYIQARLAMPRDVYMSPAFIAAYRRAIEISAELGIAAGIYDDYNWISGQAAGRTVEGHDELRERHLFWSTTTGPADAISGIRLPWAGGMGAPIMDWQYEDGTPAWCDWTIEAAVLHPAGTIPGADAIADVTDAVTITSAGDQDCRFALSSELPADTALTVFVSARSRTSRIINYLKPEAARRFIACGLEPLIDALDGLIPDPVDRLFYDQPAPAFYCWDQLAGNLANSLPFDASLVTQIETRTGLPLGTALLALVSDIGPDTSRVRAQVYATVSNGMNTAFFGTMRAFAENRGLLLTGHEILPHVGSWALNGGFTGIDPRVAPAVDFFGIDAYRHLTAADANNFDAQLAPKLADSVARANGRSRCMVETYATALRTPTRAAGQWELTLKTLRAHVIRLHCLGMRQSIWHGLYETDGQDGDSTPFVNPRFDFGPGLNFEPWWPFHDLFADETARLSAFIEPARPLARVAIFYPLQTAWAEGPRHAHATHTGLWCEALLKHRTDFLIVSEAALATATFRPDGIEISGQVFDAVVLPAVSMVESPAMLHVLAEFGAQGGHVWSSGSHEQIAFASADDPLPDPATDRLGEDPTPDGIAERLQSLAPRGPSVRSESDTGAWLWIGEEDHGAWRIVLFNDGTDERRETLTLGAGFTPELWSCDTGTVEPLESCAQLDVTLAPQELRCLRLGPLADGRTPIRAVADLPSAFALPTDSGDAILLDTGWTLRFDDEAHTRPITVDRGWHEQGLADRSGTGIYISDFELAEAGTFVLDLPEVHTAASVAIDGKPPGQALGRRAWSPYRFALGRLDPGPHRLEISVSSTAANRYYAGTPYQGETIDPCGLSSPPRLVRMKD